MVGCQKDKFEKYNIKSFHGIDEWTFSHGKSISLQHCKSMIFRFLNNPLQLDSNVNMLIFIDTMLIYKGTYKENFEVCIPEIILSNPYSNPALRFIYDSKTYRFLDKTRLQITSKDEFIYFTFYTNDYSELSGIIFSQQYPWF